MNKFMTLLVVVCFLCWSSVAYSTEQTVTMIDDAERKVEFPLNPARIITLNTSNMELLYAVGGKTVARPDSRSIPQALYEQVKHLPSIGQTPNPNVEKIVSLEPDLVIGINMAFHHAVIPPIERAGIPFLMLSINSYADILEKLKFYGKLTGNQQKASEVITTIEQRVAGIKAKVSTKKPVKTAVVWGSPESFNMALPTSFAGNLVYLLGGINIAEGITPLLGRSQFAPLSMEYLLIKDPDVVLMITHGDHTKVAQKMVRELENHPAWQRLRAVQEKRLHVLPYQLFGVNPATRVGDAVEHIANLMYPNFMLVKPDVKRRTSSFKR